MLHTVVYPNQRFKKEWGSSVYYVALIFLQGLCCTVITAYSVRQNNIQLKHIHDWKLHTGEVPSVKSWWFDFIGNNLTFNCSQSIFYHHLHHLSSCGVSVESNVGGDEHVRQAEERVIPEQEQEEVEFWSSLKRFLGPQDINTTLICHHFKLFTLINVSLI